MNVDLERAGKALPLALAAVYVVGFLVVALHLAQYGASSLELFKIQYLAAGFWCGFAFVLYFGFLLPFRSISAGTPMKDGATAFWQGLSGRMIPALAANGSLVILALILRMLLRLFPLPRRGSLAENLGIRDAPLLRLVLTLALFDVFIQLYVYLKEESKEQTRSSLRIRFFSSSLSRLMALVVFVLFCDCVSRFALDVYPYIPFSFGGGRLRSVVFVLNDGTGPTSSFLVRDGAGPRTIAYQLLLENENSLIVISPKSGEKAIEFDRKSVAAMIVLSPREMMLLEPSKKP